MATPKCSRCDATEFEMVQARIANTKFEHKFAQCASCGAVIGILEHNSTAVGIGEILELIKAMELRISQKIASLVFRK